jgi:hypothetical protein
MIEKIITNGLSVAAVAALDVAIKLGLDYGGWCNAEDVTGERFHLKRLSGASYQTLIDKAIGMAHGSVFFIHGHRSSLEMEKNKKTARRLNKPFLLMDLVTERGFFASRRFSAWIEENRIRILHVEGEKEAPHPASTTDCVAGILEATFFLTMMDTGVTSPLQSLVQKERTSQPATPPPQSMEAAIDHLERTLSLKDKATIANMASEELVSLHFTLGDYINTHFKLFTTNTQLIADCRQLADRNDLMPKDAAAIIIRQLWQRLSDTCRIRLVK